MERGEAVDPASYYFRINPLFETSAPKYDWINRIVAIGIGYRRADGPIYSVSGNALKLFPRFTVLAHKSGAA